MRVDERIRDELDQLLPLPDARDASWRDVLRRAADGGGSAAHERRVERRGAARRLAPLVGVVAAVAVVSAVALAWPFGSPQRASVLERALAAASDGPVLHVVFRFPSDGAVVDLETGASKPLYREREVWWDPERGIHEVWKLGGVVQHDHVWKGAAGERHLRETVAGFTTGYREALANGEARLAGEGTISGRAVYWIRWEREPDPDLRGLYVHKESGKERVELLRSFGHEVAVDRETMHPVYVRELLNGEPGPNSGATVAFFESVPRGNHQFVATNPDADVRILLSHPTSEPVAVSDVASLLDRPGVWLGRTFRGMKLESATRHDVIALERGFRGGVIDRDDFRLPAVELAYVAGDERLTIAQARAPRGTVWRPVMLVPAPGTLVLRHGFGYLRQDDLAVLIRAANDDLMIAAARALQRLSR